MNKIKDKLQARAKFNKGKRVGYAKGSPVVDRETGELLENFKPTPKPTPAPHLLLLQHLLQHLLHTSPNSSTCFNSSNICTCPST
jgi:hypothetical protein